MMNEEHLRYMDNFPYYALPEDFIPDDIYGLDEEASTSCEDYIGDIALPAPLKMLESFKHLMRNSTVK